MRWMMAVALVAIAGEAPAQRAVSARAGLIHYVEGQVFVEGSRVETKVTRFKHLDEGQVLSTRRGRAELLLNPTAFLRVADNSSVRLTSAALNDTQIEVLSGMAMIDILALENQNSVAVLFKGQSVSLPSDGLYHFAADGAGRLRVYDGEARLETEDSRMKVKKGNEVLFGETQILPAKFDRNQTDALYRWNARRARYIERTNMPARFPRFGLLGGVNGAPAWTAP